MYREEIRKSSGSRPAGTTGTAALKVLSQLVGVGGVERVWSTFGWIQSKLRNRLLPENARKTVMAHMWLRLEQMREQGKWEADLLEQQDLDLTWGEVCEELGMPEEA